VGGPATSGTTIRVPEKARGWVRQTHSDDRDILILNTFNNAGGLPPAITSPAEGAA
jgi:hypothetical protein